MSQIVQSGLTDTALFVLLATSFFLIYNVSKILHFAHGTAFLVGAYVGYSILERVPFVFALAGAIAIAALLGLAVELLVYQPLRLRGATNMILLIGSLAIFLLGENVIGMIYGGSSISVHSSLQQAVIHLGDVRITGIQLIGLAGAIGWVTGVAVVLRRSAIGFYIRAIATHQSLADLTGVPSARVRRIVFLVATAPVGFAGMVRLVDLSGDPGMALTGTLYAVVPFIVGGARSVWGAAIAAAIIGFGINVSAWFLGSQWTEAFVFGLLALVVLMRPEGLIAARRA